MCGAEEEAGEVTIVRQDRCIVRAPGAFVVDRVGDGLDHFQGPFTLNARV